MRHRAVISTSAVVKTLMSIPRKSSWQERVREVEKFHLTNLKLDSAWRQEDTARELNRSVGRISEDLLLASWMRTHPKVETFKHVQDALDWVRKKKHELRVNGV
jgi:hypothetical protein